MWHADGKGAPNPSPKPPRLKGCHLATSGGLNVALDRAGSHRSRAALAALGGSSKRIYVDHVERRPG